LRLLLLLLLLLMLMLLYGGAHLRCQLIQPVWPLKVVTQRPQRQVLALPPAVVQAVRAVRLNCILQGGPSKHLPTLKARELRLPCDLEQPQHSAVLTTIKIFSKLYHPAWGQQLVQQQVYGPQQLPGRQPFTWGQLPVCCAALNLSSCAVMWPADTWCCCCCPFHQHTPCSIREHTWASRCWLQQRCCC
jgi:hypothetical protein